MSEADSVSASTLDKVTVSYEQALREARRERDAARASSSRWCETVAEVERALDDHAFDDEDGNGFVPIGPLQDALNGKKVPA